MNKIFLLLLFLVRPFEAAFAGFDDFGAGVPAAGMAEAFVAVANDASSINHNPAGLAHLEAIELTTQSGQFLKGLSDASAIQSNYVGYVQPIKSGRSGTMGLGYQTFKGSHFYNDRMLYLGYGRNLKPRIFGWTGQCSAGITLKQFHRQYEHNLYTANALNDAGLGSGQADPLFSNNGTANDTYAFDLGVLYRFDDNQTRLGAGIMNVNQPDASLGNDGEKLPLITKIGLARFYKWGVVSSELRRAKRLTSAQDTDIALGAERSFSLSDMTSLALRAGYAQGSRDFKTLTTGLSFHVSQIHLDYAFNFPLENLAETQGNHRVSLTVKFRANAPVRETVRGKTEISAGASATQDDYSMAIAHYTTRKAAGASIQERVSLLQHLYDRFGESRIDLKWLSGEFSSL